MTRMTCHVASAALFSAFAILNIAPAHAADCSDLRSRWYSRYVREFGVNWNTTEFGCASGSATVAESIYDLESPEFRANPNGYRPDFYAIVRKPLRRLRYDSTCKALATGNESTGTITLCPAYFKDSREDRAATLVHEARHLQADDASHVTCIGGKHAGDTGACDAVFYDGAWKGSGYNADIFFYNWHLKASPRNELSRAVMESEVNKIFPDRFNQVSSAQLAKWRFR